MKCCAGCINLKWSFFILWNYWMWIDFTWNYGFLTFEYKLHCCFLDSISNSIGTTEISKNRSSIKHQFPVIFLARVQLQVSTAHPFKSLTQFYWLSLKFKGKPLFKSNHFINNSILMNYFTLNLYSPLENRKK